MPSRHADIDKDDDLTLSGVQRKLVQFKELYTSYRKDEADSKRRDGSTSLTEDATARSPRAGPPRRRVSVSSAVEHQPAPTASSEAAELRKPSTSRKSEAFAMHRLMDEADIKERTAQRDNLHSQLSRLQSQHHLQEAREDELRASFQRQVQQLQEKLAVTSEQLHRLETERWEVLEAVSTVAAGSVALEREQRELERGRLALAELQKEVAARDALLRTNIQVPSERLSPEELSSLATQYGELDTAISRADLAIRRRLLLLAGQDPDNDGDVGSLDLSHDPCLQYLQSLREALLEAKSFTAATKAATPEHRGKSHGGVDSRAVECAPVVRHLQRQVAGLARALVLLSSEAEADAARMTLAEAQGRERIAQLHEAEQERRRLLELVAEAPALMDKLREQREENEALHDRLRSMRKKLKGAFEGLAAQNKELRERLAAEQARNGEDSRGLHVEIERLKEQLTTAHEELQVEQQRTSALITELEKSRKLTASSVERSEQLKQDLSEAQTKAAKANRRAQELATELTAERGKKEHMVAEHDAQLADIRSEVKQQLEVVVESYSEELESLHAQLRRMDAVVTANAAAAAQAQQIPPARGGGARPREDGATSSSGAGRAEAWRVAYEGMRETAAALRSQLDVSQEQNALLQAQLKRLTAAAAIPAVREEVSASEPTSTAMTSPSKSLSVSIDRRIRGSQREPHVQQTDRGSTAATGLRRTPAGWLQTTNTSEASQSLGSRQAGDRGKNPASSKREESSLQSVSDNGSDEVMASAVRAGAKRSPPGLATQPPPHRAAVEVLEQREHGVKQPKTRQQGAQTESQKRGVDASSTGSQGRIPQQSTSLESNPSHTVGSRQRGDSESSGMTGDGGSAKYDDQDDVASEASGGSGSAGDSLVDMAALDQQVAALQEQLAALTHHNAVITDQVVEMRLQQDAHQLEKEARQGMATLPWPPSRGGARSAPPLPAQQPLPLPPADDDGQRRLEESMLHGRQASAPVPASEPHRTPTRSSERPQQPGRAPGRSPMSQAGYRSDEYGRPQSPPPAQRENHNDGLQHVRQPSNSGPVYVSGPYHEPAEHSNQAVAGKPTARGSPSHPPHAPDSWHGYGATRMGGGHATLSELNGEGASPGSDGEICGQDDLERYKQEPSFSAGVAPSVGPRGGRPPQRGLPGPGETSGNPMLRPQPVGTANAGTAHEYRSLRYPNHSHPHGHLDAQRQPDHGIQQRSPRYRTAGPAPVAPSQHQDRAYDQQPVHRPREMPPQPQAPDAVSQELSMLRSQHAELHARFEEQAAQQRELHEAMLALSGSMRSSSASMHEQRQYDRTASGAFPDAFLLPMQHEGRTEAVTQVTRGQVGVSVQHHQPSRQPASMPAADTTATQRRGSGTERSLERGPPAKRLGPPRDGSTGGSTHAVEPGKGLTGAGSGTCTPGSHGGLAAHFATGERAVVPGLQGDSKRRRQQSQQGFPSGAQVPRTLKLMPPPLPQQPTSGGCALWQQQDDSSKGVSASSAAWQPDPPISNGVAEQALSSMQSPAATTQGAAAPAMPRSRSTDTYITTTPFFPLGTETSDFLDRATSVDVGLRGGPGLVTREEAATYEADGDMAYNQWRDTTNSSSYDGDNDGQGPESDDEGDEDGEADGLEAGVAATLGSESTTTASGAPASLSSRGSREAALQVAEHGLMPGQASRPSSTASASSHGLQHTTSSFVPGRPATPIGPHRPPPLHVSQQLPPGLPEALSTLQENEQRQQYAHQQARSVSGAAARPHGGPAPLGDGLPVPQAVLHRMAKYAGDEGMARPSTAMPSVLRPDRPESGPPVPPEVLSYIEQYTGGGEGDLRPMTASPSVLRAGSREVPVPPEVLSYAQQYTGDEGRARPPTAAPSVLSPRRSTPELPVPELVAHMAAQWQTGGEGVSRPATAPSSDERRWRLGSAGSAAAVGAQPAPSALGSVMTGPMQRPGAPTEPELAPTGGPIYEMREQGEHDGAFFASEGYYEGAHPCGTWEGLRRSGTSGSGRTTTSGGQDLNFSGAGLGRSDSDEEPLDQRHGTGQRVAGADGWGQESEGGQGSETGWQQGPDVGSNGDGADEGRGQMECDNGDYQEEGYQPRGPMESFAGSVASLGASLLQERSAEAADGEQPSDGDEGEEELAEDEGGFQVIVGSWLVQPVPDVEEHEIS